MLEGRLKGARGEAQDRGKMEEQESQHDPASSDGPQYHMQNPEEEAENYESIECKEESIQPLTASASASASRGAQGGGQQRTSEGKQREYCR